MHISNLLLATVALVVTTTSVSALPINARSPLASPDALGDHSDLSARDSGTKGGVKAGVIADTGPSIDPLDTVGTQVPSVKRMVPIRYPPRAAQPEAALLPRAPDVIAHPPRWIEHEPGSKRQAPFVARSHISRQDIGARSPTSGDTIVARLEDKARSNHDRRQEPAPAADTKATTAEVKAEDATEAVVDIAAAEAKNIIPLGSVARAKQQMEAQGIAPVGRRELIDLPGSSDDPNILDKLKKLVQDLIIGNAVDGVTDKATDAVGGVADKVTDPTKVIADPTKIADPVKVGDPVGNIKPFAVASTDPAAANTPAEGTTQVQSTNLSTDQAAQQPAADQQTQSQQPAAAEPAPASEAPAAEQPAANSESTTPPADTGGQAPAARRSLFEDQKRSVEDDVANAQLRGLPSVPVFQPSRAKRLADEDIGLLARDFDEPDIWQRGLDDIPSLDSILNSRDFVDLDARAWENDLVAGLKRGLDEWEENLKRDEHATREEHTKRHEPHTPRGVGSNGDVIFTPVRRMASGDPGEHLEVRSWLEDYKNSLF